LEKRKNPFRQPETSTGDDVVYYYNRSERLEKASSNAQFAASLWGAKKQGFVKTMMATPTLRYMFMMMVLFVLMGFLVDMIIGSRDKAQLGGYNVQLKAMYFEGEILVTLKRSPRNARTAPQVFSILLTAGDETVSGTMLAGQDDFGAKLQSEIKPKWVAAIVGNGEKQLELSVRVD